MDKKEEIMQSAIQLFSKQGFQATSVQEIAKSCGISKATLYHFFESKEEILIQVIDVNIDRMIQNTMNVNFDTALSPKEKLIKKIEVQFDIVFENKHFIKMLLTTFIPQNNPRVSSLKYKIDVMSISWYKNILLEAFGEKAEPYIWDFTLILQGAVHEYVLQTFKTDKEINFEEAVRFIVEQIEIMINHSQKLDPVLTSQNMREYDNFKNNVELESPNTQIFKILDDIEDSLDQSLVSKQDYEDAVSVINLFRNELKKSEPRRFLLKSLLSYLSEIEGCNLFVIRINSILKAVYT